jgi:hypothetical protein
MKILMFLFLLLSPSLFFAQSRSAWDISFNKLSDHRKEYTPKADSIYKKVPSAGYSFGVSLYTYHEGDLVSMKYGLRWNVQKGSATTILNRFFASSNQQFTTDYKINFLEVPVLVHYAGKKNNGYIELGISPYLYLNSTTTEANTSQFFFGGSLRDMGFVEKKVRVFGVCNLGYNFDITPKLALFFQGESQFRKISATLAPETPPSPFLNIKPFQEGKSLETRWGLTIGFRKKLK